MNQTQAPEEAARPGQSDEEPDPGSRSGPRVTRDQVLDVGRLRRSSSDKYVAGVAGGLARHLDIDPLIVRVVFAVTAVFGVGILLYGALWLLLPDDNGRAPVDTTPETRKVLVLVACAVAAVMLLGAVFGDGWRAFPIAVLVLAGVGVYAALRPGAFRTSSTAARYGAQPEPAPSDDAARPAGVAGDTSARTYTPEPPSGPRRTGVIWFWPTLALLAIAMGSLAMYDIDHVVANGAYPALAIAIIGSMLVVGAFIGRAGGLILLGLLAIPPLIITSTLGNDFTRGGDNINLTPRSAQLVQSHYSIDNGRFELDLTSLNATELAALDDREIDIDMSAGEVVVTVPEGLGYALEADLSLGGEIRADNRSVSGMNPDLSYSSSFPTPTTQPMIDLDIEGVAGRIVVQTIPADQGVTP